MEKRVNLFLGRDHPDGQTSVLFVITIAWFIFGTIYVIVNMVRMEIIFISYYGKSWRVGNTSRSETNEVLYTKDTDQDDLYSDKE